MSTFLPFCAPSTDVIIDRTHPIHMGSHMGITEGFGGRFQKFGSIKAEIINNKLIINGTYQTLLGFCFIMKKQTMADNNPNRE
jgi:hypothetical protein